MLRVIVIGGGAIGLLFAGKLALSGAQTALWTRTQEQAAAIAAQGIGIRESDGVQRVDVRARPIGDVDDFEAEWVLLAVKQVHIDGDLIRTVARCAEAGANVLCMQNGIGHLEAIADAVPAERLYAAVTTEGALRLSNREIAHTGFGITRIGSAGPGTECSFESPLEDLKNAFMKSGFSASISDSIHQVVWEKLLINVAVNPITALLGVPNGALLQLTECRPLIESVLREAIAVAKLEGYRFDYTETLDKILDVCSRTADNQSSMLQDIRLGRQTEIDYLNGSIVRLARKHGSAAPVSETLVRLISALEQQKRITPENI